MIFLYDVKLPPLEYFQAGNDYSGSFRTDNEKGVLSQTTFNYRVKIVNDSGLTKLMAMCFYILPWNCAANMDEIVLGRFEVSSFGLEVCEKWIRSKFLKEDILQLRESSLSLLQG